MTGTENLRLRAVVGGVVIAVKVVPGASRDKVAGILGDALKIITSAAPQKGKANAAVAATLAKALGVDRRRVQLARGQTSAHKEFHIGGITADEVMQALQAL